MFSQYLDPCQNSDDRHWFDHQIDLAAFAGQEVEIILRSYPGREIGVAAGDYDADWFSWANPRVTQRPHLDMSR